MLDLTGLVTVVREKGDKPTNTNQKSCLRINYANVD
jgi:hypothetical protein